MKFQNPSIHRLKVSNFTEKIIKISKFRSFVKICGKVLKSKSGDQLLRPN